MTEWILSAFITVFGLGGIVLAVAAIVALIYMRPLVPYLVFAAVICGVLGYIDRLQDDLDAAETAVTVQQAKLQTETDRANMAEAKAASNAAAANDNAQQAKREAEDNRRQAVAYAADAASARTDAERFDLARRAAEIASAARDCPSVAGDVRNAIVGKVTPEDGGQPASLKVAMDALRQGRRR